MADKDKQAYYKGYNDCKKLDINAGNPNPFVLSHSHYDPPTEHKEAYDAGYDRARQENNS